MCQAIMDYGSVSESGKASLQRQLVTGIKSVLAVVRIIVLCGKQ